MIRRIVPVLLTCSILASPLAAQTKTTQASADAKAFELVLERAAATTPGTYVLSGTSLQPAPGELPVVVQADVLRGAEKPQKTARVPVAIGTEVPADATVRLRVVTATGTPRVIGDAQGSGTAGHVRLVHEFIVPPGEYEIQAVVGHRSAGRLVAAIAKRRLTVPDVWSGPLAVTPVIVGDSALAGDRKGAQPFTFGAATLSPAVTNRFEQKAEIDIGFRVFNWSADPADPQKAKPDLTVDYAFFEKAGSRTRFFNKMKPQQLAADTLGKTFDAATGMVAAGMRIPLAAFPFGEFDMRVRVTDNRTKQTSEQHIPFRVVPPPSAQAAANKP
jgi:hypothetical protein